MREQRVFRSFSVAAALLAAAAVLAARVGAAEPKYTMRWVLVHDPSVAASETADRFAARVARETNGEIRVQVVHRDEYAAAHKNAATRRQLLNGLMRGEFEIGQIITSDVARYSPELWALGQPYLFRDYDHAEAVFEGPLGARITALVPKAKGLRGLGITYSGGYGVIATTGREVRKPADMARLKLLTERFAWLQTLVWRTKVEPISAPLEAFVPMAEGNFVDALETTVARLEENGQDKSARVVNMTDHYMLTTLLVVNEKFFRGLPPKDQDIVARAAADSAREERALSIKANEDGRARLEKRGVKFVDLTSDERKAFAAVLEPMYSIPIMKAGDDLVRAIRETSSNKTAQR